MTCVNIRGNVDLIGNEKCLFTLQDIDSIKKALKDVLDNKSDLGSINYKTIQSVDRKNIDELMSEIYA